MKFQWINESTVTREGDRITIFAPAKTDFFRGAINECEDGFLPEV